MQTLRKKTSPLKYKNETSRFMGEGVSFKAKLIGILEVSEARGDKMCQEALSDLKMAIRAAGEHKQRITITIAIDGLRLRDEKTGDSLYHHPVHKISFIAQDMSDSRAFGYIFGSPDTGHRFFGIKTDKAASQVVIAMRDLFQVVFALKKKEIELAKQHLEKPLFSDSAYSKLQNISHVSIKSGADAKTESSTSDAKNTGTAVADLVDLELELNSLQQGLNQMERITPMDPFGSKDDPFGDSFISYPAKPILPPPPSSGRDRSNRTSESSSIFSPKTPHTGVTDSATEKKDFSFSHDFNSSHEDHSSGDWFTPSGGNSIFEDPSPIPPVEPTKDEKHEQKKQEILSQFDVFTELDPLGTGRSKPYIDRKHFFQELKNPPKKALNELVTNTTHEQPLFNTTFNQKSPKTIPTTTLPSQGMFTTDPFGEDPFVKVDPFADSDFSKQDPFESEFAGFPSSQNNLETFKFDPKSESLQAMIQNNLPKSPKNLEAEKPISTLSTSPKMMFTKQNTFDIHFDKFEEKHMYRLHENKSLDMSSEGECAPEPPPRPAAITGQIKPPPLPPKKQMNDLSTKPPPRPPFHTDESPYDFIEKYETAPNSLEFIKGLEKSPPLPVPARKAKFDSDFSVAPERPKKQLNVSLSEDDYLTPITFPEKTTTLLPPPQKSSKKKSSPENKAAIDNLGLEGLDITLSQLTLSGLNELAQKLNIPAGQLSNMTLVQLTNFLSNFIKSNSNAVPVNTKPDVCVSNSNNFNEFPTFQADFAANFNNMNNTTNEVTYDRYAVFRELIQEEIKQTKIDSEPEEILEEKEKLENSVNKNSNVNLDLKPLNEDTSDTTDKYAALREIVEKEIKESQINKEVSQIPLSNEIGDIAEEEEEEEEDEDEEDEQKMLNGDTNEDSENVNIMNEQNDVTVEDEQKEPVSPSKTNIIEYSSSIETKEETIITTIESPVKPSVVKTPLPSAINEIQQNNTRLTSGSLSDVISGSSPEVDMTASNSDAGKKTSDAIGESWAIFDQATVSVESTKEKQAIPSEEGVSPWSSDSKEFGNGSPPEWRSKDSGSGPDQWSKKRRDQEGWWDTSAEPEAHYCSSNRRSTDSYDEEYYECYDDKPRRRRQPANWQHGGAGGHSSSSRDVSPWEEEPRRAWEGRGYRHQRPFERHRRVTDSWDEDDDYEYDEEDGRRFHWPERHGPRDTDRESRHSTGTREHEPDRWCEDWSEERRHRRRRDPRDRWCCPDWEQDEHEKPGRYSSGRWSNPEQGKWRDRKHDERYYNRDSQESPWEDEYLNDPEQSSYYLSAKRNWKQRPSSASEMDRKTGEIKSRHYLGTGGSDGERDRRYKGTRRSRSRDSQYSEPSHRHKSDLGPPSRNLHRNKSHPHAKPLESEFSDKKLAECKESNKKTSTLNRKKPKESPKTEENMASTFPRKSSSRGKLHCDTDYIPSDDSHRVSGKFNYDNDVETSEVESPTILHPIKTLRQQTLFEKGSPLLERDLKERRGGSLKESKLFPRYQAKAKSLFEDDFSPSEKSEQLPEDSSISSIKEEIDREEDDEFDKNTFKSATNGRKKILAKGRLSVNLRTDNSLKKSESVNIFAREDDPFDDDFFCGDNIMEEKTIVRNTELRWTEDFQN